jgi:Cellulase (glycosyl hydrolase family 5)
MPGRLSNSATLASLALLTLSLLGLAPAAHDIACPAPGPLPEAPIALSGTSPRYFSWQGRVLPLLGISAEYICHLSQPRRADKYCALENFDGVLADLQKNRNHVIGLWTIFNHSPGTMAYGAPFENEQPFVRSEGKWDLRRINETYLDNLERVVCAAYNRQIAVEVTLLDPWDGNWATSPFNPANTVAVEGRPQGFSQRRFFLRFENDAGTADTSPQNVEARTAQKNAVAAIVGRLKKYPNVIWEVANEPDFIPADAADLGGPVTPAQVMEIEKAMIAVIQANDSKPPHLLQVNGHSPGMFAWDVPGTKVDIASAHYTQIKAPFLGALQILRERNLTAPRSKVAMAFNEGQSIPNALERTADDVRAEAWEFAFLGGALFNAYSLDRGSRESQAASAQLGVLADFLGSVDLGTAEPASCNGAADWCQGLPTSGAKDAGRCGPANVYWAALRSAKMSALYIHHSLPRSRIGGGRFDGYKAVACGGASGTGYQTAGFQFRVPRPGCWSLEWIDPKSGKTLADRAYSISDAGKTYSSADKPFYAHDVLIVLSACPGPLRSGSAAPAPDRSPGRG